MSAGPPRKKAKRDRGNTHPLLVGAKANFARAREDRDERYVRPYKRSIVDVFVSKGTLDRALETANTLFLTLEDRGQRVVLMPPSSRSRDVEPEVREGQQRVEHDYSYHRSVGRWRPGRPTVVVIGDVTVGLTLFEISEEVEVEYDSKLSKYVRVDPTLAAMRRRIRHAAPGARADWTSKHWMPSGRLGLQAYSTDHAVDWKHQWYELAPGTFEGRFSAIAKELEQAAVTVGKLTADAERKREEARRKWEAEREEERRREEIRREELRKQDVENRRGLDEQRQRDAIVRRQKEFVESIGQWRVAQDIREYVWSTHALIADANMEIKEGTPLGEDLKWALEYADRIDPHTRIREDIARARKAHAEQFETARAVPGRPNRCLRARRATPRGRQRT
jgi:hypothetical protein